jgi:hypothetical protein
MMFNLFRSIRDRIDAKLAVGTLGFLLLNGAISPTQAQTVVIEYGGSSGGVRGTTSAIMGSPIPSPVPLSIDTHTSPSWSSDRTIRRRWDWDDDDWDDRDWDNDRRRRRYRHRDDDSITIRRTQIRNSTLVNPVIIDSSIRNSTLVNPTIIDSDYDLDDWHDWERYDADSTIIFSSPDSTVFLGF